MSVATPGQPRHVAWGVIIAALVGWHFVAEVESMAEPVDVLDALDAVALLMRESALNRKARFDDQLDAAADARDAFRDGREVEARARLGGVF